MKIVAIFGISSIGLIIGRFYALPWSIDIAMVVQIFFWFGYMLKTKGININFVAGLAALAILLFRYFFFDSMDTASRHYNNILMYFVGGISGTLFVLWISDFLAKIKLLSKLFSYLGAQSMTVLMWHNFGFKFASVLFVYGMGIPLAFAHKNYYIIYTFIATIISLLVLHMKNKIQNVLRDRGHVKLAKVINW